MLLLSVMLHYYLYWLLPSKERHGWERPGWFSVRGAEVKSYDWYGAYETRLNEKDAYKENLNLDYTFDFPAIHENVSV
jgi:sarcosine dehydrogenase